jgi:hypothetical protein
MYFGNNLFLLWFGRIKCKFSCNAVRIRFFKGEEMKVPELVFTSEVPKPVFKVLDSPSKLEIKATRSKHNKNSKESNNPKSEMI